MDILDELKNLDLKLTQEEIRDIKAKFPSKEEKEFWQDKLKGMGFRGFKDMTSANVLRFLFHQLQNDDIARITTQIHETFGDMSGIHKIISGLYCIGFDTRDTCYILYKMGFRKFSDNTVSNHVRKNRWALDRDKQKFMELIASAKQSVFQSIAKEVKDSELKTANIYMKCIAKLQDHLETIDPIIQHTEFRRVTGQIETLQNKLNNMHGIEGMRLASVDVTAKLALAKGLKEIEKGDSDTSKKLEEGTMIEAEQVDSPFSLPSSDSP